MFKNSYEPHIHESTTRLEYFLWPRIPGMVIDPSCEPIIRAFCGAYEYKKDESPTPVKEKQSDSAHPG